MTPIAIGQIIRRARKAQGLRQDELAGVAQVGLRFIVELEAGKPTIQLGKTLKVLDVLGCDVTVAPPAGLDPGDRP
jgi:y4mF family transcriptional regulator